MKKLLLATFLLFSTILTFSQWVSTYGTLGGDVNFTNAKGNAVTTDASGYSYVTGYSSENSQNDIITIKYTPTGDTVWVRTYNGTSNRADEGSGICVDNSGNVYVVGFAEYTAKSTDVVILKYSANGTLVWDKQYSLSAGALDDKGLGIAVDASGYIYLTGYTTNSTDGRTDIFTRKYDAAGTPLWTSLEDNSTGLDAQGLAIAVSLTGNVYVTGYVTSAAGNMDIVLIKYNSSGVRQWLKTAAGTAGSEDKAWGIVVDETDNVFITGYTTASQNNTDCFTAKYNSAGTLVWSKSYSGSGNQSDKAWGIVVDTDGSVFITGETTDANSNINYLTLKYSSTGVETWQAIYNGTGNGEDKAASIGLLLNADNTKSIIVTGKSWGTNANFDYATVRYNTAGSQSQVNRYSFSGTSTDVAKDLAITPSKKIIITGFSQLIVEAPEEECYITTISYDFGSELISDPKIPTNFSLYQNYPNPFNPTTSIKFDLAYATIVKLTVYDMLGKEVEVLINQHLEAGTHNISFGAGGLSSGIYFYELSAGSYREIRKMTLIK